MFDQPGASQLVLSKQQLRNQRRETTPARLGCLGLKNMCSISAGTLEFVVEPVTLKMDEKNLTPAHYKSGKGEHEDLYFIV